MSLERSVMNVLDLIKATIACGFSAFLIYNFPVLSQVIIIGLLSLLWLSYAHRTLVRFRRAAPPPRRRPRRAIRGTGRIS